MKTLIYVLVLLAMPVLAGEESLRNWKAVYYADVRTAETSGVIKTEAQLAAMLTTASAGNKLKELTDYILAKEAREAKLKDIKDKSKSKIRKTKAEK